MDRKRQLSNVAFGGDWSEMITVREKNDAAFAVLRRAVDACDEVDPRTDEVHAALDYICRSVTRGAMHSTAWHKAAGIADQGVRMSEMSRVLKNIVQALAK